MNARSRLLKTISRKDPTSSFVLTVGAVDTILGVLKGHGSLMMLGLALVAVAIALRWQAFQRYKGMEAASLHLPPRQPERSLS